MNTNIIREQQAFDRLLPELLKEHEGEFVAMADGEVLGFFPRFEAAYEHALDTLGLDADFLVAEVAPRVIQPAPIAWLAGVM